MANNGQSVQLVHHQYLSILRSQFAHIMRHWAGLGSFCVTVVVVVVVDDGGGICHLLCHYSQSTICLQTIFTVDFLLFNLMELCSKQLMNVLPTKKTFNLFASSHLISFQSLLLNN